MEDASKALFIAAGILIGILVLSLGVYLFVYMSGETGKISVRIEENQLQEFNEQFLKYQNKFAFPHSIHQIKQFHCP